MSPTRFGLNWALEGVTVYYYSFAANTVGVEIVAATALEEDVADSKAAEAAAAGAISRIDLFITTTGQEAAAVDTVAGMDVEIMDVADEDTDADRTMVADADRWLLEDKIMHRAIIRTATSMKLILAV